jgi:hypothetical protein
MYRIPRNLTAAHPGTVGDISSRPEQRRMPQKTMYYSLKGYIVSLFDRDVYHAAASRDTLSPTFTLFAQRLDLVDVGLLQRLRLSF